MSVIKPIPSLPFPAPHLLQHRIEWHVAIGGMLGIAIAGGIGVILWGATTATLPWLVAPAGASAVLIFAVPASPLAQPWPLIGGNVLSACVGLLCGHLIGMPLMAGSLAVGLAIAAMSMARCMHPPGGACALLYALAASGPDKWNALHLVTIVANALALGGVAWLFNNATGHSWPHRAPTPPLRSAHSALAHQALATTLAEWDEVIDADVADLDAIFQAVERRIRSIEQSAPPASQI